MQMKTRVHTDRPIGTRFAIAALAAAALALALPALASAATHTLSVEKTGAGTGTVSSSPAGIECGATCSAGFEHGTTVTLTGVSGANTQPVQWSGCNSVTAEDRCVVALTTSRSVTATFDIKPQLVVTRAGAGASQATVTSSPGGISCGSTCQALYARGTTVTLTAASGPHALPAQWAGCGSLNGSNQCLVTMSEARSVTATFDLEPGYSLYPVTVEKIGNGQGTVTSSPGPIDCGALCSGEFITGTSLTLTATPSPGSVFDHWAGGGCTGAGSCTTTVKKATTVKAVFTLFGQRALSVTKNGTGTVTARAAGIDCGSTCSAQVPAGKKITLSAKAATGSTFARWSGACSGTAKTCKVTMTEARSVTATFAGPPAPAPSSSVACVVPKLRGKGLKKAKRALKHAHCRLGKVRKPKGAEGALVVRSSSPGAGTKLGAGAKVGVKVGARKHKAHGH